MPLIAFLVAYYCVSDEKSCLKIATAIRFTGVIVGLLTIFNWVRIDSGGTADREVFSTKDMAQTSFGASNYLATILLFCLPWCFVRSSKSKYASSIFSVVGAGTMLWALLLTQSRGALICLVVGLLIFLVQLTASKAVSVRMALTILVCAGLAVLAIVAAWSLIPNVVADDFLTRLTPLASDLATGDMSDNNRAAVWVPVISSIQSHPFMGVGLGNESQSGFILVDLVSSAHNVLLEACLELGIFGLISLFIFLWSAWRLWRSLAFSRGATHLSLCLAGLLSFQLAILHCLGEPSFWGIQFAYLFWTALGAGASLLHLRITADANQQKGRWA